MSEPKKKVIMAFHRSEFYGVGAFTEYPDNLIGPHVHHSKSDPRDWRFNTREVTRRELENAVDGENTDAEWDRAEGFYQGN